MFNKIKTGFIAFFSLTLISIQLKSKLIKNVIDDIPKDDALSNYLKNLNKADLFLFVNLIYQKKVLSCLTCSMVLRKALKHDDGIILHIGIEERKDDLNFHAWIQKSDKVVFGKVKT